MKRTAYQPSNVFVPAGKSYSHGIIVEAGPEFTEDSWAGRSRSAPR